MKKHDDLTALRLMRQTALRGSMVLHRAPNRTWPPDYWCLVALAELGLLDFSLGSAGHVREAIFTLTDAGRTWVHGNSERKGDDQWLTRM